MAHSIAGICACLESAERRRPAGQGLWKRQDRDPNRLLTPPLHGRSTELLGICFQFRPVLLSKWITYLQSDSDAGQLYARLTYGGRPAPRLSYQSRGVLYNS